MKYLSLNNGIKIPMIGLGIYNLNDEDVIIRAIDEVCYRLIDTARMYGNEEILGNAIKKCKLMLHVAFTRHPYNASSSLILRFDNASPEHPPTIVPICKTLAPLSEKYEPSHRRNQPRPRCCYSNLPHAKPFRPTLFRFSPQYRQLWLRPVSSNRHYKSQNWNR